MVNMFSLILGISTLATGILWCLGKYISYQKYRSHRAVVKKFINVQLNNKLISKVKLRLDWLESIASIFPILVFILTIRSFIFEPFQIPSGSMMPTLLVGDFILVEKFTYGIKDLFYNKTLIGTGHPKRGDVVVFKYPANPHLNYIKRIVGLPGDKIIYNPVVKEITIQPNCYFSTSCKDTLPVTYSNVKISNFIQTFSHYNTEIENDFFMSSKKGGNKWNSIHLIEREETIDGITHRILTLPIAQDQLETYYQQTHQKLSTWIVTPGKYFVMGDNRDNSSDSRYWGFVPEENLVGKAVAIWMSFKKREGQWPTGIRLNHIGWIH